jgi:hypothetical protein
MDKVNNMKCKFDKAWIGKCNEEADESGFCEEHRVVKCCSCGAQATRDCPETSQFVCGAPLCDDCEHTIQTNGCNGGGELPKGLKSHCKKTDQVYPPWYARKKHGTILIIPRYKLGTYDNEQESEYIWFIIDTETDMVVSKLKDVGVAEARKSCEDWNLNKYIQ